MEEQQDQVKEPFDRVLTGMTDLIIATLRRDTPERFEEAKKLCDLAQGILQARGRQLTAKKTPQAPVAEQNEQWAQPVANVVNAGRLELVDTPNGGRAWRPRTDRMMFDDQGRLVDENGVAFTGSLDANALMRHMLMAFGPHAQTGAEANRARVAAEEAEELKTLKTLREHAAEAERPALDRRITQLLANMEKRSNADQPAAKEASVVPPDDSRGHPPDAGGGQANDPPRLPAHDVGGGGNGAAPVAGAQYVVGTAAVV